MQSGTGNPPMLSEFWTLKQGVGLLKSELRMIDVECLAENLHLLPKAKESLRDQLENLETNIEELERAYMQLHMESAIVYQTSPDAGHDGKSTGIQVESTLRKSDVIERLEKLEVQLRNITKEFRSTVAADRLNTETRFTKLWKVVSTLQENMLMTLGPAASAKQRLRWTPQLIPGLPDGVARLCLARVPRVYHGVLKAVSSKWKELVSSHDFYMMREEVGVTDQTVFLMNRFPSKSPVRLECMEVDLKTGKGARPVFFNESATRDTFEFGEHRCAAVGTLVLSFAYSGLGETPSPALHIFNVVTRTWKRGADMLYPRGHFAYGVINGKLYVAGGCGGADVLTFIRTVVGMATDAQVYDPETDSWSVIANMPAAMLINIFWVFKDRLVLWGLVRNGNVKQQRVFSYSPSSNEWKEEEQLANRLSRFKPLVSPARGPSTIGGNSMYVARAEFEGGYVHLLKLHNETLQWETVAKYRVTCECCTGWGVDVIGLKDWVLVLNHEDDEYVEDEDDEGDKFDEIEGPDFKVVKCNKGIVKLYLKCPSIWTSALVNA